MSNNHIDEVAKRNNIIIAGTLGFIALGVSLMTLYLMMNSSS